MTDRPIGDPHGAQPIHNWGSPFPEARVALIVVHGRGAPVRSMMPLAAEIAAPGVAILAPEAANNTWYPYPFLAPISENEPWLSSALALLGRAVEQAELAGIGRERTVLLGFSQGACLSLEFAARNPALYGGVLGFSGGLIGPEGTQVQHPGSMAGTRVFIGVSDNDWHIPVSRVQESAAAFERMDARVVSRLYPGAGHQVVSDEVDFAKDLVQSLLQQA